MKVILGIDPGLHYTGYGVVSKNGTKAQLIDHGCLTLQPTKSIAYRVGIFHDFFNEKLSALSVTDVALETPFLGKNAQNFLKLGYLRGIVYLLSYRYELPLLEFSPREVKQSVTGFGGASKEQVAWMVLKLFPSIKAPKRNDVTDALAVTLCGLWHNQVLSKRSIR